MKKIVIFAILCFVLVVSTTFASNGKIGFTLGLDLSLPEYVDAAWLGYLMSRQVYISEHKDQYDLTPGIIISTFDEEVEGRKSLAQIWKELKEENRGLKDKYLDELLTVHEADFIREYVWTYLKQQSWSKQPKNLRLKEFSDWRQQHLKGHQPESHGNIKITKETTEPL